MPINSPAIIKAQMVQQDFCIQYPFQIESFCQEIGIKLIKNRELDVDGYLYKKDGKKYIFVNSRIAVPAQQRFVIAHELGHYFLHTTEMLQICAGVLSSFHKDATIRATEKEANEFASELLLPSTQVCKELDKKQVSFDIIDEIAGRYGISRTAAAIKCVESSPTESELLVCYVDGSVRWYASPRHAPFYVSVGSTAPVGSVVWRAIQDDIHSICEISPPGIWNKSTTRVKESVVTIARGKKLLLLSEAQ